MDCIPWDSLEPLVADPTATQKIDLSRLNFQFEHQLPQLRSGFIGSEAEDALTGAPALVAGNRHTPLPLARSDILWPGQWLARSVKAQHAQPLGKLPEHRVDKKTAR
jgi:hypothetical protein